jgi:hypothetical protein
VWLQRIRPEAALPDTKKDLRAAMSYELYITRADHWPETQHWSECNGKAIVFDEWASLVEADPELAIDYSDRLTIDDLQRLGDETPELAGSRTDGGFRFSNVQA